MALSVPACGEEPAYTRVTGAPTAGPADAAPEATLPEVPLPDRILSTLEGDDLQWFCDEYFLTTDFCLIPTLTTFDDPAACEQALATCRENPPPPDIGCTPVISSWIEDCEATARDFFACRNAHVAQLTCERAGETIERPELCIRLAEEGCPGALVASPRVCGGLPACAPVDPATVPPDTDDDVFGAECRPVPQRFVVLGDSIAACAVVAGPDCVTRLVADHLRDNYSPGIIYEQFARGGARTFDLTTQMTDVEGGPGHIAVWVFAIGNDLISGARDIDRWEEAWSQVFAYFTDPSRFPDGATFMLNAQYSAYDECSDADELCGTAGTIEIESFLRMVNPRLFLDPAVARSDTVAIDHYPDFLGHGANANVLGCPHCGADNTSWLFDGAHPNVLGNHHLAEKWFVAFEQMYGPSCAP